jgi:hypothetical protein
MHFDIFAFHPASCIAAAARQKLSRPSAVYRRTPLNKQTAPFNSQVGVLCLPSDLDISQNLQAAVALQGNRFFARHGMNLCALTDGNHVQ